MAAPRKKTVKSAAALKKMALEAGATITSADGQKFNATRQQGVKRAASDREDPVVEAAPKKVAVKKKAPKRLEPKGVKPQAEPTVESGKLVVDDGATLVAQKIEEIGHTNAMMLKQLTMQIAEIQLQVNDPILDWDFEFVRNDQGYLTNIKAHAEIVKPTLN
jgi:hypothetical protein